MSKISKTITYSILGTFSGASESSSAPISSRFGSTAGSRFFSSRSSNDRVPAAISYSGSDRFRTSGSKPMPANLKDEEAAKAKETAQEIYAKSEESKLENRLKDNETVTMVTRGTSPTPPASSSFVRSRRADIGIANQKEVSRVRKKMETKDQEVQSERSEDGSRFSRFGGGGRISGAPWSSYLDKFSSNSSGSGVYARGFNGSNATNSRVNSFAFPRSNDASRNDSSSSSKVSPSSSQEIHGNRNQNEQKVFGGLSFAKTDSKTSNEQQGNSNQRDQMEVKANNGESRACTVGKSERKGLASPSILKREDSPQQHGVLAKSSDSRESVSKSDEQQSSRESSTSKSENNSQKRPSIPRLGRIAAKNESKIAKSSSNSSSKSDGLRERRSSTPKSDASSLSKLDDSSRIVEGHCQEQSKEASTSKSDSVSPAKDSLQR